MYQALHFITSFEPEISIFQGNYLTSVFLVFIFRIYYYLFPKKVIKSRFILKLDWDGEFQNFPRLIRFPFVFTLFMSALLYDSLSVETECAYDRLVNFPLIRKKIRLFPNTVADSYFPPKPYNNGKREKVIITVSRVMFSKGIDSLVRLFIEVNKQVPGWNLVIIGPIIDANYFNQLQTLIKESNLNEQIHFTNSLPYSEIKHYYEIASIFCLLSHGESFALSRLEAIMSGIPVLTTYSACGSRLKGAISMHISEVEKLEKSLLILMTNESRREELVKHGQEGVEQWEIVIKHFLEL